MAIKKNISFQNGKFSGCVDYGDGDENDVPATHALVFMLVGLNKSWKIPFAHFFTDSVNGKGK